MTKLKVSGVLDEGINARSSGVQTSIRNNSRNRESSTIGNQRQAASRKSRMQHPLQMKQQSERRNTIPVQYEPLVTTEPHDHRTKSRRLDDGCNEFNEYSMDKMAHNDYDDSHYNKHHQLQHEANRNRSQQSNLANGSDQNPQSARIKSETEYTYNHTELATDDDEDYICCDLHSNSQQPLCSEGKKNLCTLAIWAIIIFIIINRFLMHMSIFLGGHSASVELKKNDQLLSTPIGDSGVDR